MSSCLLAATGTKPFYATANLLNFAPHILCKLYCIQAVVKIILIKSPDEWATTKQACRDELVVYLCFSSHIIIILYIYIQVIFHSLYVIVKLKKKKNSEVLIARGRRQMELSETFYFQHKIQFPDKSIPITCTLVDFLEMKVEFGIEEAEIQFFFVLISLSVAVWTQIYRLLQMRKVSSANWLILSSL